MALTVDQRDRIQFLLTQYSSEVSQIPLYSWRADFCKEEMERIYANLVKELTSLNIDFHSLDTEDYKLLGFQQFEGRQLIPLYLTKVLPEDTEVVSILGSTRKAKDMDLDNRGGMLAYSII